MIFSSNSSLATVKTIRSDISWEVLLRERFPYYIGRGRSSKATCRSCGHHFPRDELRIQFEINRKSGHGVMPACEVNVCMKLECVENAYSQNTWPSVKPLVF